MTSLLLVDDHPLVAQGMATLLEKHGFDVVGIARSLEEGVAIAVHRCPDVVICDVMLAGQPAGLDLPSRLESTPAENAAVLFVSSYSAPWFIARAVRGGGSGYLLKSAPVDELVAAIQAVATGGVAFRASALRTANTYTMPTPRELQVIAMAVTGASNGEIGSQLGIGDKTVETHLARVYARYGINGRAELAVRAVREGWLPAEEPR